nr:metallophosphoesterase family protein [Treponema sp.]
MRFLVVSDIHGNLENMEKLSEEFKNADAVLFAGDFAEFGKPETGLPVLEKLCKKHDQVFAVI